MAENPFYVGDSDSTPFFQDVKGKPSKKNTNPLPALFRQDTNELLEKLNYENKEGVCKHLDLF